VNEDFFSGRLSMNAGGEQTRWSVCTRVISASALWFFLFAQCRYVVAQNAPLEELRTADQVRQLTTEEAARHYPVKLRGEVTFYDQSQFYRFIQDDTAGIYFDDSQVNPPLAAGQLVEIEGETSPGEYAPVVTARRIQILGQGEFPKARSVAYEQLASGQEDSQFVELHGIVRSVQMEDETKYFAVDIATGGGRLTVRAANLPVAHGEDLVDSTVRIRGVCTTHFNRQRQLFDIRLLVPRPEDLIVETPAPSDPFVIPAQSIEKLLQFTPQGPYGHRVKVKGTVIYRLDDDDLYLEDETEGLHVETKQSGSLLVGEEVEVLGFPAKGEYTPMLRDAIFRTIGSGPLPQADRIAADEALKGIHDCRLVRIEATVLDRARHSQEQFLVLQSGGFIFHAYMERKGGGTDFAYMQNGSRIAVTGVCLIETGKNWSAGESWRAKSFRILLRSAGDIVLLERPPWWNLQKLFWAIAVLVVIVLVAFAWVAILRRRVIEQTKIIRQKLQAEAALKERYEDLFENANDVVFTHDLNGHITSINKMGEQLFRRPRHEILSRNLVDLVVEEQRAAAKQWLDQVVKGAELPTAEWDFIDGSGQRIRLEISTRIVEQEGKQVEVEGIARDITERKRLEREILEISKREQRRIGHDLHDGVCQQLAAIAYRMDIVADQLQEKGLAESTEVERIGSLINETITQTRDVARGLFPVGLEENGLVSAVEELADNVGNLFKMRCEFFCDESFLVVENTVSLHLYYIIQEAVLNAVKHGKATSIVISITRDNDRFLLTIRDNGTGFQSPGISTGMGIRVMRYRASVIGTTLDLKSEPGQGTQITCPFHPSAYPPTELVGDKAK
jgi:PAS domain S-box-containing protein